jgi:hypothetical protein
VLTDCRFREISFAGVGPRVDVDIVRHRAGVLLEECRECLSVVNKRIGSVGRPIVHYESVDLLVLRACMVIGVVARTDIASGSGSEHPRLEAVTRNTKGQIAEAGVESGSRRSQMEWLVLYYKVGRQGLNGTQGIHVEV